jgi:hypothetical protein
MNKKFNLLVVLVSLLALGLVFGSCDNGTTNGTGGGGGGGDDDNEIMSGICEEIIEVTLTFPEKGTSSTLALEPIQIIPKFEGVTNPEKIQRIEVWNYASERFDSSSGIITPLEEDPLVEHDTFGITIQIFNSKDCFLAYHCPWHPILDRPASIKVKLPFKYKWYKNWGNIL